MTAAAGPSSADSKPAERWREALLPALGNSPHFAEQFFDRLRAAKLTFGDRFICRSVGLLFLPRNDGQRVRIVADPIAALGARVVAAALEDRALFAQFRLRPEEERLARLHAGYGFASTASRLDAFLLPDSLKFAEYSGDAPAGAGYAETLAEIFRALPMMPAFARQYEVHTYPLSARLLDALVMSYIDWGGTSKRPQIAIVDWREVPTWSEFEILKERFEKMGVPVVLADPRDLIFDGKTLSAHGTKIDLVYRRVLINDIVARPKECEALVKAYAANAVCVANTFRCKIPHVKAFFAVLTDEPNGALFSHQEREIIRRHIPSTRVVEDVSTAHYGEHIDLLAFIREKRENLVLKPSDEYGGTGVTLGWETNEHDWDEAIGRAISSTQSRPAKPAERKGAWIVQERIPIRREVFPFITPNRTVEFREMLVDLAPYLFRGKLCGFLTRLIATGLANLTSVGGQVPAFRVTPRTA